MGNLYHIPSYKARASSQSWEQREWVSAVFPGLDGAAAHMDGQRLGLRVEDLYKMKAAETPAWMGRGSGSHSCLRSYRPLMAAGGSGRGWGK